ncbi:MAG: hypothetical protein EOL87_07610 [Spartobacteria bacterium]|nr:hypothetical protein [Spartobacteria bacterium]
MNSIQTIQLGEQSLAAIGNIALLDRRKTGLLCSRKCPADKIIESYDQFKIWTADPEMTVISGFHSPLEKECLHLLLKGSANIIMCPPREIMHMRLSNDWKPAINEGRMLILSPFTQRRADTKIINSRNQFVASISNELIIPYSAPEGVLSNIAHPRA